MNEVRMAGVQRKWGSKNTPRNQYSKMFNSLSQHNTAFSREEVGCYTMYTKVCGHPFKLVDFDGVEVRALWRPVKFFHNDLDKPFLYGLHVVHGSVMLKQKSAFPKLLLQSWKHGIA